MRQRTNEILLSLEQIQLDLTTKYDATLYKLSSFGEDSECISRDMSSADDCAAQLDELETVINEDLERFAQIRKEILDKRHAAFASKAEGLLFAPSFSFELCFTYSSFKNGNE